MSKAQYEAVFDSMDADGSGTVTLEEMKVKLQGHGFRESQIEVIKNPFSFTLLTLLISIIRSVSTVALQTYFRAADTKGNEDGKITKEEYLTAMGFASPEEMKYK